MKKNERESRPGQKTYWHLLDKRQRPSEYEIASGQLIHHFKRDLVVDIAGKTWFKKYQSESPLLTTSWENFQDPQKMTYSRYVQRQRDKEVFINKLFESMESMESVESNSHLDPRWVNKLHSILFPLRYPFHGMQMLAGYLGHLAPSSKIIIPTLFQAADEMRRIQTFAYGMGLRQKRQQNKKQDHDPGRNLWEEAPYFQPLRKVLEKLLVTYDWSELFVALNLCFKPLFDELTIKIAGDKAQGNGDYLFKEILTSLYSDCLWQQEWSWCLADLMSKESEAHQQFIEKILQKWKPLVLLALQPLEKELS